MLRKSISGIVAACLLLTCAEAMAAAPKAKKPAPKPGASVSRVAKKPAPKPAPGMSGIASVYNEKGTRSASGEIINPKNLTAAHRSLSFGTKVRVVNKRNGKSVVVRIIDRGPFIRGRVIDLSPAAARALGVGGLAPVTLAVVETKA